jgi:hypothetical protein
MKRIIVICEGPTETEFCKDVLNPYLSAQNIYLQTPLVKKSGGGIVPWSNLKKQIENHLLQDNQAIVTTLIDYYGINARFQFPRWDEAHKQIDKNMRMEILESGMLQSITGNLNNRFLPYIQLHEFEGLLFNNMSSFLNHIPDSDFINKTELSNIINQYPNPELINDTPDNAPSYRLKRLIKGYNKIVYGSILAQEIGLARLKDKSPRFNQWILKLESI